MPRTTAEKKALDQVWLTETDRANVTIVAEKLKKLGYDVERGGKVSLTKVVRALLAREANS